MPYKGWSGSRCGRRFLTYKISSSAPWIMYKGGLLPSGRIGITQSHDTGSALLSITRANLSIVECSNSEEIGSRDPIVFSISSIILTAISEWPPSSKKFWVTLMSSISKNLDHMSWIMRSVSVAGGWCVSDPERSEEHTSELQSRENLVCRLLLEKKKTGR